MGSVDPDTPPEHENPEIAAEAGLRAAEAFGDDLDERVEIERLENRVADGVGRDLLGVPIEREDSLGLVC